MNVSDPEHVTLFLCGDVMTGRGIDQILPHPAGSHLREPYVQDAREYVKLAEARNGRIAKPVAPAYIWGDALAELDRVTLDARIINLETSVTAHDEYWPGKGINYRMHPENVTCLTAARIDVCGLANNHVLDYGYDGLSETLDTLKRAGLRTVGAGRDLDEARAAAVIPLARGGRVIVSAFGAEDSGIPREWAARANKGGVDLLPDLSEKTATAIVDSIRRVKGPRDVAVVSVHWGSNWGYDVSPNKVQFAHWLVDGGADVVHGHSSHHPRPIEVYRRRLILYGCGDFIDDYEGIEGYDRYRDDLVLMYFATLSQQGNGLASFEMRPMQVKKMRLNKATPVDAVWLRDTLERVSAPYGSHIDLQSNGALTLRWG
jgi:poly-gamma-glutamate capsule biosynthesis protein CapA/YwtB (metallophosphatase superfamily)